MKEQLVLTLLVVMLVLGFYTSESQATIFNFTSDGEINDGDVYGGGAIWNDATVNMYGGVVNGDLGVQDESTFNLRGGLAFEIYNRSIVNIYGGESSIIRTEGSGTTNIYGGSITSSTTSSRFSVWYLGTLNIYGGDLNISSSSFSDGSTTNIYGYDFDYNPELYVLTGFLADDSPFTLNGVDNDEYGRITFIPEPTTVFLFALGGLAILRTRRN